MRSKALLLVAALLMVGAEIVQAQQVPAQPAPAPIRPIRQPTADATQNLPAQPIGPNDLIEVSVYNAPEFSRTVRVGDDGAIRLPMVKQKIKVESMMPGEMEAAVAKALKEEDLMPDPFVTVNVVEYQSRPISVVGAVNTPITFQAIGDMTLLEALAKAGGVSSTAGTEILVTKKAGPGGTALTRRISTEGLITNADPVLNVKLTGNEEIRVPEAPKIFVVGSVTKPGAYAVQDSTESTVMKMLALSEGLGQYAGKDAFIYRLSDKGTGERTEIPVELKKIMDRKSPDVPLMASDILYIPDSAGAKRREALTKIGAGAAVASIGGIVWALSR